MDVHNWGVEARGSYPDGQPAINVRFTTPRQKSYTIRLSADEWEDIAKTILRTIEVERELYAEGARLRATFGAQVRRDRNRERARERAREEGTS